MTMTKGYSMGAQTRHQEYRYQYKTIALQQANSCGYGATLNFNLPADFIEIKNLWAHIRIQFASGEPSGNQKILGIGQRMYPPDGEQPYMKPLNLTADGNRRIDFTADLTEIMKDIEIVAPAYFAQGNFAIGIKHPLLTNVAKIELWKMDLVYTTQGIR